MVSSPTVYRVEGNGNAYLWNKDEIQSKLDGLSTAHRDTHTIFPDGTVIKYSKCLLCFWCCIPCCGSNVENFFSMPQTKVVLTQLGAVIRKDLTDLQSLYDRAVRNFDENCQYPHSEHTAKLFVTVRPPSELLDPPQTGGDAFVLNTARGGGMTARSQVAPSPLNGSLSVPAPSVVLPVPVPSPSSAMTSSASGSTTARSVSDAEK